jgi:peptidoglycan/LPS O-acetylase OafA/YrhL
MIATHSSFYDGAMALTYNSGPPTGTGLSSNLSPYSIMSFFGNLMFLQTIAAPTFGTNGPLWSLANEFWYYFLFPLLFCSIATKSSLVAKFSCAAIAVLLCYMLPIGLLLYGLIWLLGVAAFVLHNGFTFSRFYRNIFLGLSGTLLVGTLILSRTNSLKGYSDFAIGLAFASMLLPLGQMRQVSAIVAKPSRLAAEFSYTLYLVHFPIAAFLACYVLNNQRLIPGLSGSMSFIGALVVILLYSFGVYLLFERNTRIVRKMVLQFVAKSKSEPDALDLVPQTSIGDRPQ